MNALLFSNGILSGNKVILEYGIPWIKEMVQKTGAKRLVFIPYAVLRTPHEEYLRELSSFLSPMGVELRNIEDFDDPIKAVEESDGVMISGGNTWKLNKMLHDNGLISPIRKAVIGEGKLYIGWSAGTNVATPTIRTTNDMPIISSVVVPSLNLVHFQINPHYIEAERETKNGETRDMRIEEFLIANPQEIVVGLPEGTLLKISGEQMSFYSASGRSLKLFRYGEEPQLFTPEDDVSFLKDFSC